MLRHAALAERTVRTSHLPNRTFAALLAGSVASVTCWTYAADAAPAAGVRLCRASVIRPDADALSFRASCKPLTSVTGVDDSRRLTAMSYPTTAEDPIVPHSTAHARQHGPRQPGCPGGASAA